MIVCHTIFDNITALVCKHLYIIIICAYLIPFPIIHRTEQVKILETVSKVHGCTRITDPILQILIVGRIQVKSESFTFAPDSPDTHDSRH